MYKEFGFTINEFYCEYYLSSSHVKSSYKRVENTLPCKHVIIE